MPTSPLPFARAKHWGWAAVVAGVALVAGASSGSAHAQTTLSIGSAAEALPVGPFGKEPNGLASVAIGQTFVLPASLGCALTCYLQDFTFYLGVSPDLAINPAALRFRAYIAQWDGAKAANVSFVSDVQSGPTVSSQAYLFATPSVALNVGTTYVAFLSVVGLAGQIAPATATADMDAYLGNASPFADGALVYTNSGASLNDLTSNAWDFTGDPELQARFSATFTRTSTVVPEPSTVLLMSVGLFTFGVAVQRRRRQRSS